MSRDNLQFLAAWADALLVPAALLGVTALVLELGFRLDAGVRVLLYRVELGVAAYYALQHAVKAGVAARPARFLRRHAGTTVLAAALVLYGALWLAGQVYPAQGWLAPIGARDAAAAEWRAFQALLAWALLLRLVSLYRLLGYLRVHPSQLMLLSFLTAIAVGTGLFMLPQATVDAGGLPLLTALFTATSAVCVTGLIVVDTGSAFTPFGHAVLLVLIQAGGLGIMTIASYFALFMSGRLGVREGMAMQETLSAETLQNARALVKQVVGVTLAFEAAGAAVFYAVLPADGRGALAHAFNAVFHSVSAFCNAGFSLYRDSFMGAQGAWPVQATLMVLIVCGGIGFPVLVNVGHGLRHVLRERTMVPVVSVQTRLVLVVTAALLALGAAGLYALEAGGALAGQSTAERALAALFQSVTARTAGFNTIDVAALGPAAAFLLMALMFVGASPGGTGGGVKTTTFALTALHLLASARGREAVVLFRRTIEEVNVTRALSVFTLSAATASGFAFVLLLTESQPVLDILFETVSAFGTVGLSRGITPELSAAGKVVVTLAMFVGRLGSLTFLYAIVTRPRHVAGRYPSETIMVG